MLSVWVLNADFVFHYVKCSTFIKNSSVFAYHIVSSWLEYWLYLIYVSSLKPQKGFFLIQCQSSLTPNLFFEPGSCSGLLQLGFLVLDLWSDLIYFLSLGNLFGFPILPQLGVKSLCFLLKLVEFLSCSFDFFILLFLAELVEQLLVGFQLHIGNHLVLDTRLILIPLSPGPSLNLFFNLLVF